MNFGVSDFISCGTHYFTSDGGEVFPHLSSIRVCSLLIDLSLAVHIGSNTGAGVVIVLVDIV